MPKALFAIPVLLIFVVIGASGAVDPAVSRSGNGARSRISQTDVVPTLVVSSPESGDFWPIGTAQSIAWSSLDFTDNVRIDLSNNNFMAGQATLTIAENVPNTGSFCWRALGTDLQPGSYQIRVTPIAPGGPMPAVSGMFTIATALQSLRVEAPASNAIWPVNTDQLIRWSSTNVVGNLRIELLRTNGQNIERLLLFDDVPLLPAMKSWRVSSSFTTSGQIKLSSIVDPFVSAVGPTFLILVPGATATPFEEASRSGPNPSGRGRGPDAQSLRIDAPNMGERWVAGETRRIHWTSNEVPRPGGVRLELSTDSGATFPVVIADGVENNLVFNWTIPASAISSRCKVRITSQSSSAVQDVSDAEFSIVPAGLPGLRVLVPDGGETYPAGSTQRIRWASSGDTGSTVRIDFSSDGGRSFQALLSGVVNNTDRIWTVPNVKSDRCRIRIVSERRDFGTLISDISSCDFRAQ